MTLKLLRILTILGPVIFIGLFELVRHNLFTEENPMFAGNLILVAAMLIAAFFFSRYIFGVINKTQRDNLRRNEELRILNSVAIDVNSSLDLEAVLRQALSKVIKAIGADAGEILLLDEEGNLSERTASLELTSGLVQNKNSLSQEEYKLVNSIIVQEGLLEPDLSQNIKLSDSFLAQKGVHSLIAVPLIRENNHIGIIFATSFFSGQFNEEDLSLLKNMGYQISIAVENARLHEQIKLISTMEERERIAREMHDGIAQVLSFVGTKSQAARQLISIGRREDADCQLQQLEDIAQDLYDDVREAILGLRNTISPKNDMATCLKEYVSHFNQISKIKTNLEITDNNVLSLNFNCQEQIVRIIQEALSNVRKHSKAIHACVKISAENGKIVVTISDNGKGFNISDVNPTGWSHFGLQTMRERADSIDGTLDIQSAPYKGTKLILKVPNNHGEEYESVAC